MSLPTFPIWISKHILWQKDYGSTRTPCVRVRPGMYRLHNHFSCKAEMTALLHSGFEGKGAGQITDIWNLLTYVSG